VPGDPGFNYGGGGGGGGGAEVDQAGGAGAPGYVYVTWLSTYGLNGNVHQTHSTGQTNLSLKHCTPINQYTTNKGISIRSRLAAIAILPPPIPPGPTLTCTRYRNMTTAHFIAPPGGGGDITTTWTVPEGVCQILVECQGGGSGGGFGADTSDSNCDGGPGASGGTGGGYAASIIDVIPGQTYPINVFAQVVSEFGTGPVIQASSGYLGGGAFGDFIWYGTPGWSGAFGGVSDCFSGWGQGGNGGAGGDSYSGFGGSGGAGAAANSGNGGNGSDGFDYGGGGGGGGGASPFSGGAGSDGGGAFVRISWQNLFGLKIPNVCLGED
jgi:hypothetical protein